MNLTTIVNMPTGGSGQDLKNALLGALLCAVLAVLAYFVATGDAEQISGALSGAATAVSRSASIYASEIVGSAGFAADFFKDAAVSVDYQEILKDAGLLAGAGLVLKVAYDEVKNKYKSFDYSDKKKLKQGAALAAIGVALAGSGCIGPGESSGSSYTPPSEVVESHYEPVETPTVEATPEPEVHWYDEKPNYNPAVIEADKNLFGVDIEGIKGPEGGTGSYKIFDENEKAIFEHSVSDARYDKQLALDLQPEQYKALTSEYGTPRNIIFEKYDTTGSGELDTVAIRYEGTKGTFTYESAKPNAGLPRLIWDFMNKK